MYTFEKSRQIHNLVVSQITMQKGLSARFFPYFSTVDTTMQTDQKKSSNRNLVTFATLSVHQEQTGMLSNHPMLFELIYFSHILFESSYL